MTDAAERRLTLLVPGLFGPDTEPGGAARRWMALETLLARSDRSTSPAASFEAQLFGLFGVTRPADGDWPVAAVTRIVDAGVVDKDWWMRADPVHLQASANGLILTDAAALKLTPQDANALVAELMEVFTADGWLFKAAHAERWYLRPLSPPTIQTHALPEVIGCDIHAFLPRGPDAKAWHTIMNEIQILLHTSGVNQAREARGELPINSLWFWGAGRLPQLGRSDWAQVWSNEPLSLGLARLAVIPGAMAPSTATDWLATADRAGEHLVVLDQARRPAIRGDIAAWSDALREINDHWLEPALQALKQGALARITLLTDGAAFTLSVRGLRRWWRRRRSLAHYRSSGT